MRKISAHMILDGRGRCYSKGILTLDKDGTIIAIEDTNGTLHETAGVEFFSGIIVPGFVNAHCHLELSHLQGIFKEGTGFVPFLKQVVQNRTGDPQVILETAEKADLQMYKNGIVAVGDVANGTSAFDAKGRSGIYYLTFLEALGFSPERSARAFEWMEHCRDVAAEMGLAASIVPHSPYSISAPLFKAIAAEAVRTGLPLSIHSQESKEEDELYQSGTGGLYLHLRDNLGIDLNFFRPTGETALQSTLNNLPGQNNLLLVHNLATSQPDIEFIRSFRDLNRTWFVLCPGSNLYIQNKLPDIHMLRNNRLQICLGTDSLVSNHMLSVLNEMKIIQAFFPEVSLSELITWATFNGAKALNISEWAGSIEIGKRPGINLLTGADLLGQKLQPGTKVRRLC